MTQQTELTLSSDDGHQWTLIQVAPERPQAATLWLPALGVAAKHYLPLAQALAARGVAVFIHEWRGNGSSNLRPDRQHDWGYREILSRDLPLSLAAVQAAHPTLPVIIGGHSLGGQLGSCFAALNPQAFTELWLVATGTPYWRSFPAPKRYLLPLFYRFLPWLAQRQGRLNGRKLGFGGVESRSLIRDWAKVGLSGRYAAAGLDMDLEAALARLNTPSRGVLLEQDWLAPASSLRGLTAKLGGNLQSLTVLNAEQLGITADHFAWMRQPGAVANALYKSA